MKKSIILLSSILLFWACKESVDTTPACDPKAIAALKQHMIGKWNVVGTNQYDAIKTTIDIKPDGNYESPMEILDYYYVWQGQLYDVHKWITIAKEPKSFYLDFYDKDRGSNGRPEKLEATSISCDRVDFTINGFSYYFYKDGYKIPSICGADISKGLPENWVVGKWKYSIVENPSFPKSIVSPKGNVEFKDDFTVVDSNPLGILSAMSPHEGGPHTAKMIWFGDIQNKTIFYIYSDENDDNFYDNTDYGYCTFESVSCDKIVFRTYVEHTVTLERVK